ncbi:MAG: DUF4384 domain-containing protein [Candidatus Neomarinimicrobiota bacterium]
MKHIVALVTLIMLSVGCGARMAEAGPTEEAQVAADAAFVELEGGEAVPLPGVTPGAEERDILGEPDAARQGDAAGARAVDYEMRPGWFLVDTAMVFPGSLPPEQARQRTLQAARAAGLEQALPAKVSFTSLLSDIMDETAGAAFERSTWSTFALSSATGLIVDEKILSEQLLPMEGSAYRYRVVLDARVEPVRGERDPSLHLELDVNERLLEDGDAIIVRAKASAAGYLYVFYFLSDNSVMLLFPNTVMAENTVSAGQWLELPSAQDRARGLQLRVTALPNVATTNETIYAVFSRQPIADLSRLSTVTEGYVSFTAGDKSFTDFQRWLAEIPLGQRVERAVQLHIISDKE